MTKNMKVAMTAINKFFYYAMNFGSKKMEVAVIGEGIVEKYMPDCFEAFPVSLRQHLYEKWDYAYDRYGNRAVLMAFYAELDGNNRQLLMQWIMENYNDEQKLYFNKRYESLFSKCIRQARIFLCSKMRLCRR